jgi:hypothetical protein
MASQKPKRRTRKRRNPTATGPRAVPSARREQRVERETVKRRQSVAASRMLGTVGERPASPFGGLPVSELLIFAGLIGVVVGFFNSGGPALIVGAVVCGLGVAEVTAREHFSGFRSHTSLLAAIPALIVEIGIVVLFGEPGNRTLLLVPVIPVFALAFWLLRRQFQAARHARVARPPAP